MAFDFKKEYKEYYLPKDSPTIVTIPKMNFIAVTGKGDPNEGNGDYQNTIGLLYGIAYTIKMSYKGNYKIDGFFEYVVPPLEGFWWQDGIKGIDYTKKNELNFISLIRLPDFVTESDFEWAIEEATKKKKQDYSRVKFFNYDEGLCVQAMHRGDYDSEPVTVNEMHEYMNDNGYELDITDKRYHHEIYLSDLRKCDRSKLKTVIRHPIKKINNLHDKIIKALNESLIPELYGITSLNELPGTYVNIECVLSDGTIGKVLDDDKKYWCTQVEIDEYECYGIAGDEEKVVIYRYGCEGKDAKVIKIIEIN